MTQNRSNNQRYSGLDIPARSMDQSLLLRASMRSWSRRSLGDGFIDFDPTGGFAYGLFGLFLRSQGAHCYMFSRTGSNYWVACRLTTRTLGLDRDCRNRDVPFQPRNWGNEVV
jgi:hypothetical protein